MLVPVYLNLPGKIYHLNHMRIVVYTGRMSSLVISQCRFGFHSLQLLLGSQHRSDLIADSRSWQGTHDQCNFVIRLMFTNGQSMKGKLGRSRASVVQLPTMAMMQSEPFTPTSSARPESELVKGWKQLEADASLAETHLVSANFASAVSIATALLRRTLYVPRSISFETRAAYVALQALYELDR